MGTPTVLVEEYDIAASQVDGMRSAQTGHCRIWSANARCFAQHLMLLTAGANDDNSRRHAVGDMERLVERTSSCWRDKKVCRT